MKTLNDLSDGRRGVRQCGAALIEFVLAVPLYLMMLTVVIDGGVYMYQYLRVTHITGEVAREMATTAATNYLSSPVNFTQLNCTTLATTAMPSTSTSYACAAVAKVYNKATNVFLKNITFKVVGVASNKWGGLPLLTVEGTAQNQSCISCFFLPSSFKARAKAVVALEIDLPIGGGCPYTGQHSC